MLTIEQIKARATSPREALLVSIEEWTWRAGASEEEIRTMVLGGDKCGTCRYYGKLFGGHVTDCGDCPLRSGNSNRICCSEYYEAWKAQDKWQEGEANIAEVRAAFWQMVARLDSELAKLPPEKKEEPKLGHGDYGVATDGFIHLGGETHWLGIAGSNFVSARKPASFVHGIKGNLKDDLAAMQEDVGFYEKKVQGGGTLKLTRWTFLGEEIEFSIRDQRATASIAEAEEIILKLRQLVATAKRKGDKKCAKDC